ncbi:Sodium/calcium exchanger 3,Sodium/calcium exchanger 1,Sodium/calcium exchanger 2 [Lepeophtheirus salmonis]|uniref:non-specific serine/threonine protein kinase n=1 Tax=Lepeophtheirus salmonis TaxID=72036 RepID=A0A7R8CPK7_LEPSM|nr:Sodium/calcium exchanger 3,Sodium/calcium exchanger 1,Sodium/calcium exchanger 2 [Lepeophtheirus salmonis]CAF2884138.1 Sodium/calcium exchanger 3,Sodium/calcium exchanger 1,Sodium/calcium exchanger 2 [Lepeophtheirus salmonis]
MYVTIGEPKHIAGDIGSGEGVNYEELDSKDPETLTEEEKIALLGRPRLGDITKIQIRIKESKEFKSSVDRMMQRGNASVLTGASSWKDQFLEAFSVQAGDEDDEEEGEEGEEKMPTCGDYIMHFLTLFWKIIFSVIPPAGIANGYPCFVISIAMIGACTALIGDVAGHLGCFIFLKDSVNAIAFVALGTSVPDTFASKVAAIQDETADASVGNVTGSNAVNVFLGIGIAWSMAAIYWWSQGDVFQSPCWKFGLFRDHFLGFCLSTSIVNNTLNDLYIKYLRQCYYTSSYDNYCLPTNDELHNNVTSKKKQFNMDKRRLLIVSSRVRHKSAVLSSIRDNGIYTVQYNFETMSIEDILLLVANTIKHDRVTSIAFILHSSEKELFLCRPGESKISLKTMIGDQMLESLLNVEVGISSNLQGSDIQVVQKGSSNSKDTAPLSVGGMYFNLERLESSLKKTGKVSKDGKQKLKGFEKIRLVGKGAFGNAILYQRQIDGLFVIIKEINMLELSASDRALALNEVKVLAKMDHPNIVAYFDSFEVDGVLMIEMEYADGGNLADDLEKRTIRMKEQEVLDIFCQMVSAIRHMHSHNVLHRDLKNGKYIFNKRRKNLRRKKSDIWALGCILYEMACLHKTFEGANLPALVNKIVRGQFAPIKGDYSPLFKQLVRDLLQRDPDFRPTASHVMLVRLPELVAFNESLRVQEEEEDRDAFIIQELDRNPDSILESATSNPGAVNNSPQKQKSGRPARSVLYDLKGHESGLRLTPIQLPTSIRIIEVSSSGTHFIALTSEFLVYSWGLGSKGQLGHGTLTEYQDKPLVVDSLKAKSITKICADGSFGCLGHGDWNSSGTPKLIEALLSVDVSAISCGSEHVVMVDSRGEVYSWGVAKMSLNTDEMYIVNVKCNGNGTMLLCDKGTLYACGENRYNRLGLDDQSFYMFGNHVDKVLVPTKLSSVSKKYKIVDYDLGMGHTVCITHDRKVVTFGKNTDGQLGRGHTRNMIKKSVSSLVGPTFTLIGTNENVLYVWGTRHHSILGEDTSHSSEQITMKDVILEPTELLALYASEQHLNRGETTTCPVPRPPTSKSNKCHSKQMNIKFELEDQAHGSKNKEYSAENEIKVPDWLEAELSTAETYPHSKNEPPAQIKNQEVTKSKDDQKLKKKWKMIIKKKKTRDFTRGRSCSQN